jgi:TolB protein
MPRRACLLGVTLVLAGLAAGGFAGAAARPGLIVFSTFLPEYPLPDNFQVDRTYVVGKAGGRIELAAGDLLSPNGFRVASVRSGTELWVSNVGGSNAHRVTASETPISHVSWSPDGSRLAYVSGGVWVAGADGSPSHEIFAMPGQPSPDSESWSPDGTRLTVGVGGDLWLVAADGSMQKLLFQPATSPAWADEGVAGVAWAPHTGALALTIATSAGCGPGIYENCADWYILTFDRLGNRLGQIASALDAAWSQDGKRLAFESGLFLLEPEQVDIEVTAADGSHPRVITRRARKLHKGDCWEYPAWVDARTLVVDEQSNCEATDEGYDAGFAVIRDGHLVWRTAGSDETVAPRGTRVSFLNRVRGHTALFTVDIAAAHPHAVEIAAPAGQTAWSADGRFLAFTVAGSRYRDLELLSANGHRRRVLRIAADRTLEPAWYGSQLVYSSQLPLSSSPSLWTVRPDGTGLSRLPGTRGALDPSWSPDGGRIAFAYPTALATIAAGGRTARTIVRGTRLWYMNPSWSPDGKEILYNRGSYGVFVVGSNGGPPRRLLKGSDYVSFASQAWSPDGTTIAYSGAGDIELMNADGSGARTIVACCGNGAPSWSPDGSMLAFYCDACSGGAVAIANSDGTNMHVVVANSTGNFGSYPNLEAPAWSPDGKELVFSGTACTSDAHAADPHTVTPAVCVVGTDGGGLHALTPQGIGAFAPSWRT